ncbi:epoxyqueuosine reductase QueH [Desulforhopalus singaporensis]|uniref:Epoxyqueuosine reductase QueH n=1 Tax=Desulforhopalus singaporensis TaxID=91360 RepID=A0A1H0VX81_9BACT|nr:epoxyqueuosine reductase QueH [Desulforhopalus singaporensis]SDP83040.1 hypothetical protein SAMN05660330_04293 [Desulforhopalus singaporensis]
MNTLLHVCCGPCSVYPVEKLRLEGFDITGYFFNPNIHPFREFKKRLDTLVSYADEINLPLIVENKYGLVDFVRKAAFNEKRKCTICYLTRLEETARKASAKGFKSFSTTLLYSKYQNHNLLIKTCELLGKKYNVEFLYRDFREGWKQGIEKSIDMKMYRQPYCGCIYSEQERYDKSLKYNNIY